jgi:nucleotide-binding universal stress UspA family protein
LCPTDFSEGSEAAISQASELAIQFGAEIYLMHVVPIPTVFPTDAPQSVSLAESNQILHSEAEKHLQGIAQPL